jgi:DNA transformation protein
MKSVRELRNIGPRSAEWLEAVGIHTEADLVALGAAAAYRRVKADFPDRVTLNLLWSLEGALLDIPWNELPEDIKEDLRRQVT